MQNRVSWQIFLLGGLRAQRGDVVVEHFRSQKIGQLLAYLALNSQRLHTREELCELLWPDAEIETARANLRTALAALRKPFETLILTQGYSQVGLERDAFTTDVSLFEDGLKQARQRACAPAERVALYQRALTLYTGPLLPQCYEPWALSERDRLTELYLTTCQQLTALHEQAGALDQALQVARRALAVDPLREESQGEVIRLLLRSGESAAAQRHFDSFAQLLEKQLGISPSQELRDILKTTKPAVRAQPVHSPLPVETREVRAVLPIPLTRFFGREPERATLTQGLRGGETRLFTIAGPGGSGKTRLALEVAHEVQDAFPQGVDFIPLADLPPGRPLAAELLRALSLPVVATRESSDVLIDALLSQPGRRLLVLDCLEHLIEPSTKLVIELLERVPELTLLVTSRVLLLCDGEQALTLSSLPLVPSQELFVDRVRALCPDFTASVAHQEAITQICTRLEGIPLALELAASRAQMLTPRQILERLDQRLDFLVSRKRDTKQRHQTLRAAIDWSYKLLDPELQRFFAQLCVFRGGWTLEAAEHVCQEPLALDYLAHLRECSLIQAEEVTENMRFRMLETLREYGCDALKNQGLQEETQVRHLGYFVHLATQLQPALHSNAQAQTIATLRPERENLRAAITSALLAPKTIPQALELLHHSHRFWFVQALYEEFDRAVELLLKQADQESISIDLRLRLNVLDEAAGLALMSDRFDRARALYETERELASQSDGELLSMNALYGLALLENVVGRYQEARVIQERVLAVRERQGDTYAIATAHNGLGITLTRLGEYTLARQHLDTSLRLKAEQRQTTKYAETLFNRLVIEVFTCQWDQAEALGQQLKEALQRLDENAPELESSLQNLQGLVLCERGALDEAQVQIEAAQRLFAERKQVRAVAQCLLNLGRVWLMRGELARSEVALNEALQTFVETHDHRRVAESQEQLARLCLLQERFSEAAGWLLSAEALRAQIGSPLPPLDQEKILSLRQELTALGYFAAT